MISFLRYSVLAASCLLLALAGSAWAQTSSGSSRRSSSSSARPSSRGSGVVGRSSGSSTAGTSGPRQYRSNTLLGDAIIQVDPESRSLVVITDEETHAELEKVIVSLDQPRPQVLIKVVFVEVTWNKGLDLGVEGSYSFNLNSPSGGTSGTRTTSSTGTSTGVDGQTTTTTTNLTQAISNAATETVSAGNLFGLSQLTQGSFARVVSDNWSATLRALATKGKVEILSRPSIMARNNQEAVIVVGQEVPFVTNSRITDAGQTINTVTYDNVGIILKVTPFITTDGAVEMIVAPEISSLTDQTVAISNNATAPVIAKRSAETVVVTPNRTTVVIGGLMETQRTNSIQKIPLLGDIPLLGVAFRRTVTSDTKRELLIFLTPEIVNNGTGLKAAAVGEVERTELINDSFQNGELNRYMDNPLFDRQEEPGPNEPRKPVKISEPKPEPRVAQPSTPRSAAAPPTSPAPEPAEELSPRPLHRHSLQAPDQSR